MNCSSSSSKNLEHTKYLRTRRKNEMQQENPGRLLCDTSFHLIILTREKLCFTQLSTRIYKNKILAVSDCFHMFTQSLSSLHSIITL